MSRSSWCCCSSDEVISRNLRRCFSNSSATTSSFESKFMSMLAKYKKNKFINKKLFRKVEKQKRYLHSSVNGLQNHLRSMISKIPSLHFWLFGNSMSSVCSARSSQIVGNFLSSSVCRTTCIARRFSWAFLRTDSMSPTAKPISKFIKRIGIKIIKRPSEKIRKLAINKVGIDFV